MIFVAAQETIRFLTYSSIRIHSVPFKFIVESGVPLPLFLSDLYTLCNRTCCNSGTSKRTSHSPTWKLEHKHFVQEHRQATKEIQDDGWGDPREIAWVFGPGLLVFKVLVTLAMTWPSYALLLFPDMSGNPLVVLQSAAQWPGQRCLGERTTSGAPLLLLEYLELGSDSSYFRSLQILRQEGCMSYIVSPSAALGW